MAPAPARAHARQGEGYSPGRCCCLFCRAAAAWGGRRSAEEVTVATRERDLKRLVRARMQRPGESYTTARAHLRRRVLPPPTAPVPATIEGLSRAATVLLPIARAFGETQAAMEEALERGDRETVFQHRA